MEKYKEDFITFLVQSKALVFGEFTLKSGRVAPHFLNTGMFFDGDKLKKLGEYYANAIKKHFNDNEYDTVYGPAYKGIPLCTATSIALHGLGTNKGYTFNRKKKKEYAMKDNIVGLSVDQDSKLVLVDDVITAGTSIRETIELLKEYGSPEIKGIVVSIDRMERGTTEKSALRQVEEDVGIPIKAIVTLREVIEVLYNKEIDGKVYLDDGMKRKVDAYLEEYGVR